MSSKEKIGFVGVGRLGSNMARRLAEENYKISAIYDVNVEATTGIADELDAEVCNKLSRVTELADVILTVVSDDGRSEERRVGKEGGARWGRERRKRERAEERAGRDRDRNTG